MRTKFGLDYRNEDWRCASCCHVRTGTILLGIWHLVLHILALAIISVVLIHPELVNKPQEPSGIQQSVVGSEKVKMYEYQYNYSFLKERNWTTYDINIGMGVTICTFAITALMVYGAVKGNPTFLMPFFCLQVFDFCIASLTVIGYFSYMPDVRETIKDNPSIPLQQELLKLDTQWLSLIVLVACVLLMMVKAYFIGVVWSCYKYLIYRNAVSGMANYIDTVSSQVLLPPDYDTATKDPKYLLDTTPPPPYAATMRTI